MITDSSLVLFSLNFNIRVSAVADKPHDTLCIRANVLQIKGGAQRDKLALIKLVDILATTNALW